MKHTTNLLDHALPTLCLNITGLTRGQSSIVMLYVAMRNAWLSEMRVKAWLSEIRVNQRLSNMRVKAWLSEMRVKAWLGEAWQGIMSERGV